MMILTLSIFVRFNNLTRIVYDPFSKIITQRYGQLFFRLFQTLQILNSSDILHSPKTNILNPKNGGWKIFPFKDDFQVPLWTQEAQNLGPSGVKNPTFSCFRHFFKIPFLRTLMIRGGFEEKHTVSTSVLFWWF